LGAQALYERWLTGESGIESGVGHCQEFDPHDCLTRRETRRTDRFTQLAATACQEALGQAGWLDALPYPPERIGCLIGTAIGGMESGQEAYTAGHPSLLTIPLMMPNAAAGYLALRYGFKGPAFGVVSACAAGADAIGAALRLLRAGDVDAIVTGGAEAPLTPFAIEAFQMMDATSRSGVCCPFDARRDGFVMSEGAAVLVLERPEAAAARGAEVLGELLGYGASVDAYHLVAPDPEGAGAMRAIKSAIQDGGIAPQEIDYVNAHGTSTPLNDRTETRALKQTLGDHAHRVPISSTKSAVGHSLGASPAVEAVATVLSLRHRMIPPTLNYEQPDPELDLDYVPDGPRPIRGRNGDSPVAISNSFGFGGHNSVLVFSGPPSHSAAASGPRTA
jgi:3-oxoacyl-[acyl-carrier-protein] synthase II